MTSMGTDFHLVESANKQNFGRLDNPRLKGRCALFPAKKFPLASALEALRRFD